ncbi:NAD(P)-dependent oxidoreductase [Candidatus Enterococcus lowellii]
MNKNSIAKMKNGVLLLNSARSLLIVEEDLKDALESGKISVATLDVVSTEPICADNPLLKTPNTILIPRMVRSTKEAKENLMNTVYTRLF